MPASTPATSPTPTKERSATKRSLTGPLTIAAIVMFGLSMLALLWNAPRSSTPAPANARFGAPPRSIRVISANVANIELDRAIAAINNSGADIVMLQGVATVDVERVGRAIGMSRATQKADDVFYPAQNFAGPAAPFGNAIYSRWQLYEGRSIPNRGGSFGVWGVVIVDGTKFMLACVSPTDSSSQVLAGQTADDVRRNELAMLIRAYEELDRPPMLLAGKFAPLSPAHEKLLSYFGESSLRRADQVLFASGGNLSPWTVQPIELPADTSGLCADIRPR